MGSAGKDFNFKLDGQGRPSGKVTLSKDLNEVGEGVKQGASRAETMR